MSVVITEPALQSQAAPFPYLPPTGYSLINVKLPQPLSRVAFRWSLPSIRRRLCPRAPSAPTSPRLFPSASACMREPCWLWSMSHACFVICSLCHVLLSHPPCLLSPWRVFRVRAAGPVSFLSAGRDVKSLHSDIDIRARLSDTYL